MAEYLPCASVETDLYSHVLHNCVWNIAQLCGFILGLPYVKHFWRCTTNAAAKKNLVYNKELLWNVSKPMVAGMMEKACYKENTIIPT